MEVEGIITRLDGPRAFVRVQRSVGCGRCHEPGGCHGGVSSESRTQHCQEYAVDNACMAPAGAKVSVEVPDGATLRAALIAYGLPVTALLGCAALGQAVYASDLGAALGALAGLGLATLAVKGLKRSAWVRSAQPRIVNVLELR